MTWFKVDDTLHSHPKARQAGLAAMGLWVLAGSYSSAYMSGGRVSCEWVLSQRNGRREAQKLVDAGLWTAEGDAYIFKDWDDYNPTVQEIEAKRANDRQRQRRRRQHTTKPDVTP